MKHWFMILRYRHYRNMYGSIRNIVQNWNGFMICCLFATFVFYCFIKKTRKDKRDVGDNTYCPKLKMFEGHHLSWKFFSCLFLCWYWIMHSDDNNCYVQLYGMIISSCCCPNYIVLLMTFYGCLASFCSDFILATSNSHEWTTFTLFYLWPCMGI